MVLLLPATSFGVAGCGHEPSSAAEKFARNSSSPATSKEPSPELIDNRLVKPFTYDSGTVVFSAVPGTYKPEVSQTEAYAIFWKSDASTYNAAFTVQEPQVFLADYTTIGAGPGVRTDPTDVGWDHVHSWIIRFTQVPSYPAGPAETPGSSQEPDDSVYFEDVVVVVNSDTGKTLSLYNAVPDTSRESED